MRIKRIAALVVAAATALSLAGCSSGDDDGITIGIKFDQPGLGLKSGDSFSGFDVDVAHYIAKELGYDESDVTFEESPSPNRENLLASGQVDMIVATYSITDERKEKVAFAGPYFIAGQDLLVDIDDDEITGPDVLDGKKLCSVQGSTSAQKVKDDYSAGVQLQEFDTYSKCIEQLLAGSIDAVTTDDIILAGFAAQPTNEGKLKVVGNTFSQENYGVGISQDSEQCEDINKAITKMIDDGSWEQFIVDNMGADYKPNAELNPPTLDSCS